VVAAACESQQKLSIAHIEWEQMRKTSYFIYVDKKRRDIE
jgi:hypothetical protein